MGEFADHLFVSLFEAAPDAVVCFAGDGRIALVNAQAERLFGYARDELAGHHVEMLVPDAVKAAPPAHRARYVADPAHRARHVAAPRPTSVGAGIELVGHRRDGSTFPAEVSLSAVDSGDEILVMAVVRDETERRHAAETMARLASIIQSSHAAVISETLGRVVTIWNPGAERLYGYSSDEIIGRHIDVLIPAELRVGEHERRAAITRGERVEIYLTERLRKDGTTVAVSVTLSPVTDSSGAIVGVSTGSWDVTGQQRADARLRRLLEAAPDAVVCVAGDGRIALVNAQAERLFGYRREELAGQPVEILVPDAVRAAHPAHRAAYVADPRLRPMGIGVELAGRRRDGSTFPAEISLSSIDADEGVLVMAAVRNVTERLELQAERERLRKPGRAGPGWNASFISRSGWKAWVSWPAGSPTISTTLLAVISNYAAFVKEAVAQEAPAIEWEAVRADIEQVLVNMAVNARDAMPGGGKLIIETADTNVDEAYAASRPGLAPGQYASLKISDTGTGIPADILDRVFEPFFTTKPKGAGSGLGLATAYGIVTQADGHLKIYSEPGIGTTLTILLPATRQPARSAPAPQQAPRGGGETVLVVEDEAAMREVTRRILARNGYQVITATGGHEAIEAAASHPGIDILLTDVIMPRMLGKEAAERIRAVQPAVKVLFMSGYTQGVLGTKGVLEAGVHLIEKPFTQTSLLAKLREVLSIDHHAPTAPAGDGEDSG